MVIVSDEVIGVSTWHEQMALQVLGLEVVRTASTDHVFPTESITPVGYLVSNPPPIAMIATLPAATVVAGLNTRVAPGALAEV